MSIIVITDAKKIYFNRQQYYVYITSFRF